MRASECVYLPKGVVLEGYIKAAEGLHGPVRFCYRATNAVDKAKLQRRMEQQSDAARKELVTANFVAERLTEWDVLDENSEEVEITGEVIAEHLHPAVNLKLYHIVCGNWATDTIPDPLIPGTENGVDLEAEAGN